MVATVVEAILRELKRDGVIVSLAKGAVGRADLRAPELNVLRFLPRVPPDRRNARSIVSNDLI